jgi:ATP-dependent Clp protease ATP-binding subunit ClpA
MTITPIIKFNKLSDLSMRKIVGKFIGELNELLAEKQLRVRLTEKAVDELMAKGFDSKMGARPLQRQINDLVKVPLSKKILFDRLENCTITAVMTEDKVEFNIEQDAVSTVNAEGIIIV